MTQRDPWPVSEAMELLKQIRDGARDQFYIGLTGSLLFNDTGNDLDVIVYPHSSETDPDEVMRSVHHCLRAIGMRRKADVEQVHRNWARLGSMDKKAVEIWRTAENRKVDVFYLR